MGTSSLGGKKQKSAHLTDRETGAQRVGASSLGLRACLELVPDRPPFHVRGLVLPFSGPGCVCMSQGESVWCEHFWGGMWGGNGKGGALSMLPMNRSHSREWVHRQKQPDSDSRHHPTPPWSCCPVWTLNVPEEQTFHPASQGLAYRRDTARRPGGRKGQGGLPGGRCLGASP